MATTDVCCLHGVSSATVYELKARYGDLEITDARRLRALEEGNARLKKLLAEPIADSVVLKDVASMRWLRPAQNGKLSPTPVSTKSIGERRTCRLVGVSRRMVRYRSSRPDDAPLRQRLRELAAEGRRSGYRRPGYLLAREGKDFRFTSVHGLTTWIYAGACSATD